MSQFFVILRNREITTATYVLTCVLPCDTLVAFMKGLIGHSANLEIQKIVDQLSNRRVKTIIAINI